MYKSKTKNWFRKIVSGFILLNFLTGQVFTPSLSHAQSTVLNLPMPGAMVGVSPSYVPLAIKGLKVFPENPFRFDFIIDTGNSKLEDKKLKEESNLLIKYFLAALTIPDDDQWVNLSPYEKDRVIPNEFGVTEMGRDLLAQDYLLKQLTASLIYPEHDLGKKFWERVYRKANERYGVGQVPVNTFNKVWIMPDHARVYESGLMAFITESHLKVMLEEDYLAQREGTVKVGNSALDTNPLGSQIIREIVLPEIEKEVNEGQNFIKLRQIYHSMIMAAWFKRKLKNGMLDKIYIGANKVAGVDVADKQIKQKIYDQYLAAFKKGVYDYIREEYDEKMQESTPRKYFAGGVLLGKAVSSSTVFAEASSPNQLVNDVTDATEGRLITVQAGLRASSLVIPSPSEKPSGVDAAYINPNEGQRHPHVYDEKVIDPAVYPQVPQWTYSFKDYMEAGLHDSQWGYYATGRVEFGEHFSTYPYLLSPFFGRMVAVQAFKMWQGMRDAGTLSATDTFHVIEFGAGAGDLAYDFLEYVEEKARTNPDWKNFADQFRYRIYERSAGLRQKQEAKLARFKNKEIIDGDARNPLATIAPGSIKGLIVSNEVPDAFGAQKVFFKGTEAEVAFVLPHINSDFMNALKMRGLPSEIVSLIVQQDSEIRKNLQLPASEDIYLSPATFKTFMDFLSKLSATEYEQEVKNVKFNEIYIPAKFVPGIAEHIDENRIEYINGLAGNQSGAVQYVNLDAEKFIREVGEILQAGYVVTIDYGQTLNNLLTTVANRPWNNF